MGDDPQREALNVLCVDDDPDIRLIIKISLGLDANIKAFEANSVATAKSVIDSQKLDLVLLDALMPGANGPALLDYMLMADGTPPIPVIFITADVRRRTRYEKPGVLGVIAKPFNPITLADEVRSLLEKATTENVFEK